MPSQALETQGTTIARGNGSSPETFTTIGEITNFNGPGGSASIIDVTHLGSDAKEKRMGLADEGQFNFDMNFVPNHAQQQGLMDDRADRLQRNFRITFTDGTIANFAGYVTTFSVSGGVDDKVGASATIEITGSVTWSYAT